MLLPRSIRGGCCCRRACCRRRGGCSERGRRGRRGQCCRADEVQSASADGGRSRVKAALRLAVTSKRAYEAQLALEREREARLQQMLELQAAAAHDK
eukprot:4942792-Prymnesium_polylepis.1